MSGSTPRSITGSQPGMVDPSQPQRLLHFPTSTLSFASFNPRTASSNNDLPDLHKLSLHDQLNNAKRVVIETGPNGESFWRFVPKARRDEGVTDEGVWPRCVSLCGELVLLSQEQWDIYKLDPFYECRVYAPPNHSTITIAIPTAPPSPHPTKKRQMAPPSPPPSDTSAQRPSSLHEALFASSDEEDEVEDMIIDDPPLQQHRRTKSAGPSTRTQKVREEILIKNRESRRAKLSRRTQILSKPPFDFDAHTPRRARSPSDRKRNLSNVNGCFRAPPDLHYTESVVDPDRHGATYEPAGNTKRNRTMSPSQIRKNLSARRASWDRLKKQRQEEEMRNRRLAREQALLHELYSELPHSTSNAQPQHRPTDPENPQTVYEESDEEVDDEPQQNQSYDSNGIDEQEREASIAESRRKLADLEADKPLWEQAARAREARERAEEETRRALAEERKKAKLRREAEERLARAREEEAAAAAREGAERQERETAARRTRARRQRQDRWYTSNWSTLHALARYRELSEIFDETKFTAEDPLTFDIVPWPILKAPVDLSVEDVDWVAVEKFFSDVKPLMRANEYKSFVEKSQRRFHPDRWRSRNVLKSVADESERACLEVAANTVAQALTPLWRDVTGR